MIVKRETLTKPQKPDVYNSDLPQERLFHYLKKSIVAIDTETRGLVVQRDRLCLVQICDEDGLVSLVRFSGQPAHNLKQLLEEPRVTKLFHFARFDVAVMKHYLNAKVHPIWCTKIASKLVRTYTDKHGLKDLGRELLGLELDKSDQTSDWAKSDLTESQLEYAANDVRVLVPIYKKIKALLEREGRLELAESAFQCLPTIAELDLQHFKDVFEH